MGLGAKREALIRKHGIPLPLFEAFLRALEKKYRGKVWKYREKMDKTRKPVVPDPES